MLAANTTDGKGGTSDAVVVAPARPLKRHCAVDLRAAIAQHGRLVKVDRRLSARLSDRYRDHPSTRPCHVLEDYAHKWHRILYHPELPSFPCNESAVLASSALSALSPTAMDSPVQKKAAIQIEQLLWDREHAAKPCASSQSMRERKHTGLFGSWRSITADAAAATAAAEVGTMSSLSASVSVSVSLKRHRGVEDEAAGAAAGNGDGDGEDADANANDANDASEEEAKSDSDSDSDDEDTVDDENDDRSRKYMFAGATSPLMNQALEWWQAGHMCDLELVWLDHSVPVHEFVMCTTADFFAAAHQFQTASASASASSAPATTITRRRCVLPQWAGDAALIRTFCKLLYGGAVELEDLDFHDRVALLANADFYGATWLVFLLLQNVNTTVREDTLVEVLNLAQLHHVPLLTRWGQAVACNWAPNVVPTAQLDGLNPTDTAALVAHPGFRIHELDVFLWLQRQVEQQELTPTAAAKLCHDHLRWGQIALHDLQRVVAPCPWVDPADQALVQTLVRVCAPRTSLPNKITVSSSSNPQDVIVSLAELPDVQVDLHKLRMWQGNNSDDDDDDDDDDKDQDDDEPNEEKKHKRREARKLIFSSDADEGEVVVRLVPVKDANPGPMALTLALPPANACWFVGVNVQFLGCVPRWLSVQYSLDFGPRPNCLCPPIRLSSDLPCNHMTWHTVCHMDGASTVWSPQQLRWGSDASRPCGRARYWRLIFHREVKNLVNMTISRIDWLVQH